MVERLITERRVQIPIDKVHYDSSVVIMKFDDDDEIDCWCHLQRQRAVAQRWVETPGRVRARH
jgi:hypothetical protein